MKSVQRRPYALRDRNLEVTEGGDNIYNAPSKVYDGSTKGSKDSERTWVNSLENKALSASGKEARGIFSKPVRVLFK